MNSPAKRMLISYQEIVFNDSTLEEESTDLDVSVLKSDEVYV